MLPEESLHRNYPAHHLPQRLRGAANEHRSEDRLLQQHTGFPTRFLFERLLLRRDDDQGRGLHKLHHPHRIHQNLTHRVSVCIRNGIDPRAAMCRCPRVGGFARLAIAGDEAGTPLGLHGERSGRDRLCRSRSQRWPPAPRRTPRRRHRPAPTRQASTPYLTEGSSGVL